VRLPSWAADESRLRPVLLALGVVVLVGLVGGGAWWWHRSQESRGLAALADANMLVQQAEAAPPTSPARDAAIKALEGVIAQYPRLSAVGQAAYELGNLQYAAGRYGPARGAFELAVAKDSAGSLQGLAGLGVGYTWEAEKKYDNAIKAYEQVSKGKSPKTFLYEEALMAQARAQAEAGKGQAAVEIYQRLLRESPESPQASDLRGRIASLQGRSSQ